MPKYRVHLQQTVSTAVEVEAESVEDALDNYWKSPKMPGSMAHQAFGDASVDESGDWEPVEIYDENGETVWSDTPEVIEP